MSSRTIWVIKKKRTGLGRRHVAIFGPNADDPDANLMENESTSTVCPGTVIHVVGSPMTGFCHEFKRNCDTSSEEENVESAVLLGSIDSKYIIDPKHRTFSLDQNALGKGTLDDLALKIPAPRPTKDFLNPANAQNIKTCQDWMVDFVRFLADKKVIDTAAVQVAEGQLDPQTGIGLRPARVHVAEVSPSRPEKKKQEHGWQLDETGRWRRWDVTTEQWRYQQS